MAHVTPVTPNIPLLVSGVASAGAGLGLLFFGMDFANPDLVLAGLAITMLLLIIYGIVGTLLGLATVIPGVSR